MCTPSNVWVSCFPCNFSSCVITLFHFLPAWQHFCNCAFGHFSHVWRSCIRAGVHVFVSCPFVSFPRYSIEFLALDLSNFVIYIQGMLVLCLGFMLWTFSLRWSFVFWLYLWHFLLWKKFLCWCNQIYQSFILLPLDCESWLRTFPYTEVKEELTVFSSRCLGLRFLRPRGIYCVCVI